MATITNAIKQIMPTSEDRELIFALAEYAAIAQQASLQECKVTEFRSGQKPEEHVFAVTSVIGAAELFDRLIRSDAQVGGRVARLIQKRGSGVKIE